MIWIVGDASLSYADLRPGRASSIVGALVITVAIIATAEVARALRFINVAFGAWLVAAPFLLTGVGHLGAIVSVVVGIALVGLSLPRGKRSPEHYASWDKYVI